MSEVTPPDDPSQEMSAAGSPHVIKLPRLLYVALIVLIVFSVTFAVLAVRLHHSQDAPGVIRPSGVPASVSTHIADLMALSPVPARPAPNFTLTDQNGRTMSLSSFKGKAVVLEFMDPHCIDICPIVSREFVDAYHNLGSNASKVVFIAINVNQYYASVADMATFTTEHQLNVIPSWHFFTGTVGQLTAIWHAYGVEVIAPNPNKDIVHTSIIYFIDPSGRERFLANPVVDHTRKGTAFLPAPSITSWGQGISLTVQNLIK